MKQVTLDYIFRTSSTILYKRLTTPSDLSEWFADDVSVRKGIYEFKWNGTIQPAIMKIDRKNLTVQYKWLDKDKEFLEFRIEKSTLTKDLTLYITDFIEDTEDIEDAVEFWNNIIVRLKRKLGVK